jgi:hypothetical protein
MKSRRDGVLSVILIAANLFPRKSGKRLAAKVLGIMDDRLQSKAKF